jgi:hypothetical protein
VINYMLSPRAAPAAAGVDAVASALAATAPEADEEVLAAVLPADDGDGFDAVTAAQSSNLPTWAGVAAVLASSEEGDLPLEVDVDELLAAI